VTQVDERGTAATSPRLAARLVLALIGVYRRFISPLMPRHCRYEPTCSAYAAEAISAHGLMRGSWLAVRRIGRCHPWAPGGLDPVPGARAPEERRSRPAGELASGQARQRSEVELPGARGR
jgi:putative membrane protein insertion efficiency factor